MSAVKRIQIDVIAFRELHISGILLRGSAGRSIKSLASNATPIVLINEPLALGPTGVSSMAMSLFFPLNLVLFFHSATQALEGGGSHSKEKPTWPST